MSLLPEQVAAIREIEEVWPDASVVIIGASALGFYYDMRWRQTADVDVVVAVDVAAFPGALPHRSGWKQHETKEHEFRSPEGVKVDVLPVGAGTLNETIEWSSGHVMSLACMDLAFAHKESRDVGTEATVSVAPPKVVCLLKMVAYCDRPDERERDLEDTAQLLDGYVNDDDDRRWQGEVPQNLDFDLAPAYLLGLDIGRCLVTQTHREAVEKFLRLVEDPESVKHALMLRRGPARWRAGRDDLERRLAAFREGLVASQGAE